MVSVKGGYVGLTICPVCCQVYAPLLTSYYHYAWYCTHHVTSTKPQSIAKTIIAKDISDIGGEYQLTGLHVLQQGDEYREARVHRQQVLKRVLESESVRMSGEGPGKDRGAATALQLAPPTQQPGNQAPPEFAARGERIQTAHSNGDLDRGR